MPDALDLPEATRRLIRTADGLTDAQYAEPSGLPGWTRAHVLAHLALNAEALAGVLRGVVESQRVPMYPSQEARDAAIEELAGRGPAAIRTRLLGGSTDLTDAITAVPDDQDGVTFERTPGGPTYPVAAVPGMRLREVEIHHADLDAGYGPADWSPGFAAYLLDTALARVEDDPCFTARATDLDRTWEHGTGGPVVSGRSVDLAWWVTGRGAGEGLTSEGGALPQIGGW